MNMLRRLAVILTGLLAAAFLATGAAAAAPADDADLTPRERAGLHFAGDLLGALFGGGSPHHDRGF
ncbi:hypothetical protein [Streptomyces celluloflavus]|uniref:hypothetical protein n=1 Tax=Streptomyces celluloflavus TaxID=58344 RepID=UPI00366A1659